MLDKKDQKILKELREDSRQSLKDISRETKIRPSTIHNRIQKLVKDNVIERFTIKTNPKKTGEQFVVYVLVKTAANIPDRYFSNPHIKEVFGITGQYDLIMKCRFTDIEGFNTFIIDFRNLDEVQETLTLIGTVQIKEIL